MKYYGNFLAVDKLNLGIPQGECFGLLGVNGAGKTTTFKMMTGDHPISHGSAYLMGYNVKTDIRQVKCLRILAMYDTRLDMSHFDSNEKLFTL